MRKAMLLMASLCLFYAAKAGDNDSLPTPLKKKSTYRVFYGELGGPGALYSLNYDQRFIGQHGFGARIGYSGIPSLSPHSSFFLLMPFEINYLVGEDRKNYIELGAGGTYVNELASAPFPALQSRQSGVAWHYSIGYRYQSPRKHGFNFRIFVSPIIGDMRTVLWGGISFGSRL